MNFSSKCLAGLLAGIVTLSTPASGQKVLLEAEQFADLGGWDLDQQSMDQMGSPYLLAHGLGVPVEGRGDDGEVSRRPAPIASGCGRATGSRRGKRRARREDSSCS